MVQTVQSARHRFMRALTCEQYEMMGAAHSMALARINVFLSHRGECVEMSDRSSHRL
jgi:hypothetical protein